MRRDLPEGHPDSLRHRKSKDRDRSDGLFRDASTPQDQERLDQRPVPVQIHPTFMDRVAEVGISWPSFPSRGAGNSG
jgi:hypothetical protein